MKRTAAVLLMTLLPAGVALAQEPMPIVAEGVIRAPVREVWAAWSTSEGLRSWLAPHAEIEMRIGGVMRANYSASGSLDDPQVIVNKILAFEPDRMLSIQVATAPANFPFPNAIFKMWTVMYFEPAEADHTRVRVVGLGFTADEESRRMRAFFERGNAETIENLRRHFAGAK
jgi:uncharacterized protein YndB with AHSA1/START domain